MTKKEHPEALRPLLPEIDAFARHNHFNVLHPILRYVPIGALVVLCLHSRRLMATGLELPEETFVNIHQWDAVGETYGTRLCFLVPHGRMPNLACVVVRFMK